MESKCILCQGAKDYRSSVFLAVNLDKLQNIVAATFTDSKTIEQDSICQNCNQFICTYDEFKSSILTNEEILKRHVETIGSSVLEELLVPAGQLDSYSKTQPVTCCRTCYKVTTEKNRIKLDSYQNFLGTLVLTCLPGLNIFLTDQCFICSLCHNTLVAFYQFVTMCQEALKDLETTAGLGSNQPSQKAALVECSDTFSESEEPLLLPTNPPKGYEEYDDDEEKRDGQNGKRPLKKKRGRPKKNLKSPFTKTSVGVRPSRGRKPGRKSSRLQNKRNAESESTEGKGPDVDQPHDTVTKPLRDRSQDSTKVKVKRPKLESPKPPAIVKEMHQCQICPFTCPAENSTIWAHLGEHRESSPQRVHCWKCGVLLQSMGGVISHFATHDMGLYLTIEEEEEDDDSDEALAKKPFKQPKKIICNNVDEFIMAIQCELCQKNFENYVQFRHHRKSHIVDEVQRCPVCPFSCNHITSMQTHLNVHHDINYLHKVITTTKVFNALLSKPSQVVSEEVTEEPVNCQDCLEAFTSISDYASHDCTAKDRYCCGDCTFSFPTIDKLDSHKCIVAQSKFKQLPDPNPVKPTISIEKLITTISTQPNFECAKCVSGFHDKSELLNHICDKANKRDQSNDINLPIITAIKSEFEMESLDNNPAPAAKVSVEENVVSSSTTVEVQNPDIETVEVETAKSLICKGCKYSTTNERSYKFHSELCVKRRRCPYDEFVTDKSQELEIHLFLVHSRVSYACPHCNFLAFDKSGMQAHNVGTHADEEGTRKIEPSKMLPMEYGGEPPPLVPLKNAADAPEVETIALDSDSEDEFIETPSHNTINAGQIKQVVNIDPAEASKLISQGVPVVRGAALSESPIVFFESEHGSSADSNIEEIPLFNRNSTLQPDNHADVTEVAIPDSSTVDPDHNTEGEGFVISDDDDDDDYSDDNPSYSQKSSSITNTGNKNKNFPKVLVLDTEQKDVLKKLVVSDISEKPASPVKSKSSTISFTIGGNGVTITSISKKGTSSLVKTLASNEEFDDDDDDDNLVILSDEDEDPVKATARKISSDNSWAKRNKNINAYLVFHGKVLDTVKEQKPGMTKQARNRIILEQWRNMSEKEKYPFVEEARLRRSLVRRENPEMFEDKSKNQPKLKQVKLFNNEKIPRNQFVLIEDDEDEECVILE